MPATTDLVVCLIAGLGYLFVGTYAVVWAATTAYLKAKERFLEDFNREN